MAEPGHKAPLRHFLARNPFPNGLTDGLFYREKMRAIHHVAPIFGGARAPRILEIGGGQSGLASYLYPQADIITLDIDPALASRQPPGTRSCFVVGDACHLPFASATFDIVTLFDVLEHIPDDARAATEALRVLRPGGFVLASAPNADWHYPYYRFMTPLCPPEAALMAEWGHVRRGYDRTQIAALFGGPPERTAGFINPLTAWYHDLAFSKLGRPARTALYAMSAPAALLGYLAHRPGFRGTQTSYAWRQ
jgi:SAM-dependent methyltransferase